MDPLIRSFEALLTVEPDAPAVIMSPRDPGTPPAKVTRTGPSRRVWTRSHLDQRAQELESSWATLGLSAGKVVMLSLPPGPDFIAAWIAIRRAGACALLADSGLTEGERDRLCQALPPDFRVTAETEPGENSARLDLLPGPDPRPDREWRSSRPLALAGAAVVKLTSGTSGTPRGVITLPEHLDADGRQLQASMGITPQDRFLCIIPFTHSYGFSLLPTSLLLWGCVLVVPGNEDPMECARREHATVLPGVPAWYRARMRMSDANFRWPETIRLYVTAGEPMLPRLAQTWRKASGRPIQALYGSSECGGITFDRTGESTEAGRVGTAVEGVELEVVAESKSDGVEPSRGFLRVHSKTVASGYWPDAEERRDHLMTSLEVGGMGSFQTEDMCRFHGEELELLGRASSWINVHGKKVDPREVESTILLMEGVDEVAVVGIRDAEGVERIRAVVASKSYPSPSYLTVSAWCRQHLAAFKVPRSILIVETLPRNERGKLDSNRLTAT